MYCSVCGNQLIGTEIACDRCGNAVVIPKKHEINQKEDIVREAQICHLNDVLNLECAHKAIIDKLAQMDKTIASLGKANTYFAPYLDLSPEKTKLKNAIILFIVLLLVGFMMFYEYKTALLCAYVIIIGIFVLSVIRFITNTRKKKQIYNHDRENYNKAVSQDEKRVADELREKKALQKQYLSVCEDLKESYKILTDAYNANIIPAPYRNIYSVYYLKQFLSTSSISFTDALLHCNLDNIKTAVEGVINQQRYMIVQNAVANAINGKNMNYIISQNYDILKKAAEIERNARMATNYSRAAAASSAASALFSSLTYFS